MVSRYHCINYSQKTTTNPNVATLAQPCHLWQTLSALGEQIPQADTLCHHHPSRIWRKSNWTHANEMQMKDSSKFLFIIGVGGGRGSILASATKSSLFHLFQWCLWLDILYTHPPPIFSPSVSSFPFYSLHPTPRCISTITNYRRRNAGWNVWPGACRILYHTPHWYDRNNMGGKAIKTTLHFTSPIFSGLVENDNHGGGWRYY